MNTRIGTVSVAVLSRSFAAAVIILSPCAARAIDLDEAKQKGLVGETGAGYIAPVAPVNGEVQGLVKSINSQRKDRYQDIAKKNGTPVAAVEGLAGKKAIQMTPPGQFIQHPSGGWIKKEK